MASVLMALSLAAFGAGDRSLLPREGFSEGWILDGSPKVYEGEALYDHIDGGGEIFLELGFEACTVQRYRGGSKTLALEIYRMRDSTAALGVYLMQCGRENPDPALAERHTVGRSQLLAVKGRYYLAVTSSDGSPGLSKVLVEAARAVLEKVSQEGPPAVLSLLPEKGRLPHSERIFRGPVGLQSLVTLGEGDALSLHGRATAVSADYDDGDGESHTLIVAAYGTAEEAKATLRHLTLHLDSELKILSAGDDGLVFRDQKGRFGRAAVQGSTLEVLFGLARKPAP